MSKKELNLDDLDQVQGGYAENDKYSHHEYQEAGVIWQHNLLEKDKYYIDITGARVSTSQADAEKIVENWRARNGKS